MKEIAKFTKTELDYINSVVTCVPYNSTLTEEHETLLKDVLLNNYVSLMSSKDLHFKDLLLSARTTSLITYLFSKHVDEDTLVITTDREHDAVKLNLAICPLVLQIGATDKNKDANFLYIRKDSSYVNNFKNFNIKKFNPKNGRHNVDRRVSYLTPSKYTLQESEGYIYIEIPYNELKKNIDHLLLLTQKCFFYMISTSISDGIMIKNHITDILDYIRFQNIKLVSVLDACQDLFLYERNDYTKFNYVLFTGHSIVTRNHSLNNSLMLDGIDLGMCFCKKAETTYKHSLSYINAHTFYKVLLLFLEHKDKLLEFKENCKLLFKDIMVKHNLSIQEDSNGNFFSLYLDPIKNIFTKDTKSKLEKYSFHFEGDPPISPLILRLRAQEFLMNPSLLNIGFNKLNEILERQ